MRARWVSAGISERGRFDIFQTGPSPPTENFLKPVCGISVVKRKITPVFTEVISYLVDSKGIEPSTSAMRKDSEYFFSLFLLLLAVSAGVHFICKPL